jgi:hypothetical protein
MWISLIWFLLIIELVILVGLLIFYFCISLYLFGDLAIYGSAVPKSIRDVIWFVDIYNENLNDILCIFQSIWTNQLYKYHYWWFMLVGFFINTTSCLSNTSRKNTKINIWQSIISMNIFRLSFFVHWVYSFLVMHKKRNFFNCLQLSVDGLVI